MKRIYDFCYCLGAFTPEHVWYSVRVGVSDVDQRAHRFVLSLTAGSPSYLYAPHTPQMAALKESIALGMVRQPSTATERYTLLLRQKYVDVIWLARFLKHYPAALLNSQRIDTPITEIEVELSHIATRAAIVQRKSKARRNLVSQSLYVKNLSNHESDQRQRRASQGNTRVHPHCDDVSSRFRAGLSRKLR